MLRCCEDVGLSLLDSCMVCNCAFVVDLAAKKRW